MSDAIMSDDIAREQSPRPHMDAKPHALGAIAFVLALIAGIAYAAFSIAGDMSVVGDHSLAIGAFVLLGIALLIALGFEFVDGFHDTANAVATAIYTTACCRWWRRSGPAAGTFWACSRPAEAVAFTVVTLPPVELILQVGSSAGYAMIFALLIAAIIWNLAPGRWGCRTVPRTR